MAICILCRLHLSIGIVSAPHPFGYQPIVIAIRDFFALLIPNHQFWSPSNKRIITSSDQNEHHDNSLASTVCLQSNMGWYFWFYWQRQIQSNACLFSCFRTLMSQISWAVCDLAFLDSLGMNELQAPKLDVFPHCHLHAKTHIGLTRCFSFGYAVLVSMAPLLEYVVHMPILSPFSHNCLLPFSDHPPPHTVNRLVPAAWMSCAP